MQTQYKKLINRCRADIRRPDRHPHVPVFLDALAEMEPTDREHVAELVFTLCAQLRNSGVISVIELITQVFKKTDWKVPQ